MKLILFKILIYLKNNLFYLNMIKFLKLKKRQRKENDKNKKEECIIKIEESKDKSEEGNI